MDSSGNINNSRPGINPNQSVNFDDNRFQQNNQQQGVIIQSLGQIPIQVNLQNQNRGNPLRVNQVSVQNQWRINNLPQISQLTNIRRPEIHYISEIESMNKIIYFLKDDINQLINKKYGFNKELDSKLDIYKSELINIDDLHKKELANEEYEIQVKAQAIKIALNKFILLQFNVMEILTNPKNKEFNLDSKQSYSNSYNEKFYTRVSSIRDESIIRLKNSINSFMRIAQNPSDFLYTSSASSLIKEINNMYLDLNEQYVRSLEEYHKAIHLTESIKSLGDKDQVENKIECQISRLTLDVDINDVKHLVHYATGTDIDHGYLLKLYLVSVNRSSIFESCVSIIASILKNLRRPLELDEMNFLIRTLLIYREKLSKMGKSEPSLESLIEEINEKGELLSDFSLTIEYKTLSAISLANAVNRDLKISELPLKKLMKIAPYLSSLQPLNFSSEHYRDISREDAFNLLKALSHVHIAVISNWPYEKLPDFPYASKVGIVNAKLLKELPEMPQTSNLLVHNTAVEKIDLQEYKLGGLGIKDNNNLTHINLGQQDKLKFIEIKESPKLEKFIGSIDGEIKRLVVVDCPKLGLLPLRSSPPKSQIFNGSILLEQDALEKEYLEQNKEGYFLVDTHRLENDPWSILEEFKNNQPIVSSVLPKIAFVDKGILNPAEDVGGLTREFLTKLFRALSNNKSFTEPTLKFIKSSAKDYGLLPAISRSFDEHKDISKISLDEGELKILSRLLVVAYINSNPIGKVFSIEFYGLMLDLLNSYYITYERVRLYKLHISAMVIRRTFPGVYDEICDYMEGKVELSDDLLYRIGSLFIERDIDNIESPLYNFTNIDAEYDKWPFEEPIKFSFENLDNYNFEGLRDYKELLPDLCHNAFIGDFDHKDVLDIKDKYRTVLEITSFAVDYFFRFLYGNDTGENKNSFAILCDLSPRQLQEKIEGVLTLDKVLNSLKWIEGLLNTEDQNKIAKRDRVETYLRSWIENLDQEMLELFVQAITGSPTIAWDGTINLDFSLEGKIASSATCFRKLNVAVCEDQDDFNQNMNMFLANSKDFTLI